MKTLLMFLTLCVLASCSSSQSNDELTSAKEGKRRSQQVFEFHQKDLQDVNESSLRKADDRIKNELVKCLSWESTYFKAYDYRTLQNGFVIFISSIQGTALYFVDSGISKCLRLTKDECDLMEQTDDYEKIWCDLSEAVIDGNELILINQHQETLDYGNRSTSKRDSITLKYDIGKTGLQLLQKDSIRIEE